ncbi:hypothetical protein [Candidatus Babela massiliensis]|uniref:Uncharacterized protein n=1 Tax=Candidatus Babela massiliensis TaxID=673862 RepID=V6DGQ5_9BACT|nr:hypothetical protein [Candidatus Babela massiliensis]CDK30734.1 hypothetical protein BABL1_gene_281 [Candidatus Babela massiliensis]
MLKILKNITSVIFISFVTLIFPQNSNLRDIKIPNREMVILLENMNMESIDKTLNTKSDYSSRTEIQPSGIGAMTGSYLIALHQQAAPMIVSRDLIANALEHKKLFYDFLNLDINQLCKKYLNTKKFESKTFLKQFKDCCIYSYNGYCQMNNIIRNSIEKNLQNVLLDNYVKDKRFNYKYAPTLLKNICGDGHFISGPSGVIYFEMMINIICYTVGYNDWIIKKITDDLYLLIPKKYLNSLDISLEDIKYNKNVSRFTTTELKLGLKVNHMQDIDFNEATLFSKSINKKENFIDSLKKVFIDKKDLKKHKIIWSVYCGGHGLYVSPENIFLPQLSILEKYYNDQLNDKRFENLKKALEIDYNQIYQHPESQLFDNCCQSLGIIKEEKRKINDIKETYKNNGIINDIDTSKGVIVSLSKEDFKNLLMFLNNNIDTAFLYYTSCYAGGLHLVEPYTENNKPLIFNYDIVSGTLAENMSMQEMPLIFIPPYFNINNRTNLGVENVSIKHQGLKLKTSLKLNKFFNNLRNGLHKDLKNFREIVFNLHPYTCELNGHLNLEFIANIPSVRYKNTGCFKLISNEENNIFIFDENLDQKKTIKLDKEVALLYRDYISQKIVIDKLPVCITSMVSDFAGHVFESIVAPKFTLEQIIEPFLHFSEIVCPKIFWIKDLRCAQSKETRYLGSPNSQEIILKDLIIVRNVLNLDKLKDADNPDRVPVSAYIYFNLSDGSSYKIMWPRFRSKTNNFKIYNCDSTTYKKEYLALKPDLLKSLKDNNQFVIA